jgi:8-oxo-dGTP diphosphatase
MRQLLQAAQGSRDHQLRQVRDHADGVQAMTDVRTISVTAGVLYRDGQVLIARRKDSDNQGGLWEFPGGKVEPGEDPRAALARELREELGIEVAVGRVFDVVSHIYGERHIVLIAFCCRLQAGEPRPVDCADVSWVTIDQLDGYTFAPADVPLVVQLKMPEAAGFTFAEYAKRALSTETAGRPQLIRLDNAALGLAGEAGEFADTIKKVLHQGHPLDEATVTRLKTELGDALWYVNQGADALASSLDEVARLNNAKLRARYPNGFDPERSMKRGPEDI